MSRIAAIGVVMACGILDCDDVDVEPRRVVLFTPPDHVRILGADDVLEDGDVLPGFRCTVAEMFA